MAKNENLARVYGGDDDAIWLAPIGTDVSTITIDTDLSTIPAFEEVGWLSEDGVPETASGSVTKLRGHQGGRVVRTIMSEGGTSYAFTAYETKKLTNDLWGDVKSSEVTAGVRTEIRSPGQKVSRRVAVLDFFDQGMDDVKERVIIEVFEITPNGDRGRTNADIAAFPFSGEAISDIKTLSTESEDAEGE